MFGPPFDAPVTPQGQQQQTPECPVRDRRDRALARMLARILLALGHIHQELGIPSSPSIKILFFLPLAEKRSTPWSIGHNTGRNQAEMKSAHLRTM